MTDSWRRWNRVLLIAFGALTIVFLIGPSLVIVPDGLLVRPRSSSSRRPASRSSGTRRWSPARRGRPASSTASRWRCCTAVAASILGTLASLGLARGRFPGKAIANALILSPLVVPVVVIAIGMFSLFVRWKITGSVVGLIVAHTALSVPYVVVSVTTSLRTMDRNLEMAAANLGADPVRTFRHITLPLIMPGVFAGALFAFLSSWDEVVVAIFLTTTKFRTLPTVMWEQVRQVVDPDGGVRGHGPAGRDHRRADAGPRGPPPGAGPMSAHMRRAASPRATGRPWCCAASRSTSATSRPSTAWTWRSARASSSRSSGPSGSGKTTTLRMIAGLHAPVGRHDRDRRHGRQPRSRPTSATWAWCSRTTPCSRT